MKTDLNLTDDQVAKIQELKEQYRWNRQKQSGKIHHLPGAKERTIHEAL